MSLGPWRVVRTTPGEFIRPADIGTRWESSEIVMPTPTTIAAVTDHTDRDLDTHDWWARTTVTVVEATRLEFAGITVPATVFVDGSPVAECESMFLPVTIDLDVGDHEIGVLFGSLRQWMRTRRPRGRWRSGLVADQGLRWSRTTLIGRAPVYGDLPAPIGFWRPVTLTPRRDVLSVVLRPDPLEHLVTVRIDGVSSAHRSVTVTITDPAGTAVGDAVVAVDGDGHAEVTIDVPDPLLWWPNGHGSQSLYRATVRDADAGRGADPLCRRVFGFRTVTADESDSGFTVVVNGHPVFCRGVTWTPPDPITLQVDPTTMRTHLEHFADAGATMIRVVGGMVHEQDEFWAECARLGLLVWQDAMVATFDPPDELADTVAREIEHLCARVSGNPALAVVSGGSETVQQPEMLGRAIADTTIATIDRSLPAVVAEHGHVPYVRASPSAPPNSHDLAIRPDTGIAHWFGVGGYLRPVADVASAHVRFAAESLAFANPPSTEFVERHFGSPAVAGHDPRWKRGVPRDRGASWDFEDIRDHYVREIFAEEPLTTRRTDPERYLQLGRLAVAECMARCFAHWRRSDSGTSGALVLSSKDLTPGAGWGLLDGDGGPKAALAVLRRVWAPIAVVAQDAGLSGIRIDLHNDTGLDVHGVLTAVGTSAAGHRVVDHRLEVSVPARGSTTLHDSDLSGGFGDLSHAFRFGRPVVDAVEFTLTASDGTALGRDVVVVDPRGGQRNSGLVAVSEVVDADSVDLRVGAQVALRYVSIEAPGWASSDNHFHLVAGSEHRVRLTRVGDVAGCTGTVSSIDSVGTATIRPAS